MYDNTDQDKNAPDPQSDIPKGKTAAEQLINSIIESEATLFHDQRKVPYIAYHGDGSLVDILSSKHFKTWLANRYWTLAHKPLPRDADNTVSKTLAGFAVFENPQIDLNVRHSKNSSGYWYDLGDGSAVHLDSTGWTINPKPPILFRRYSHQQVQNHPVAGGSVTDLRPFINIPDDDDATWLLFVVNLITAFVPGFPHPILIVFGPQGAGKTTPMRIMKKLLDPSVLQGTLLPTKEAEFVQQAEHHAFLFFDNLSSISARMSDALARAATGDGFSSRELYTTDDDFIRIIQRPIALNGINQVISKPDLLDRSILIKVARIAENKREAEEQYWEAFNGLKPGILGAIFDVLSAALAIYPDVVLDAMPRMADFARLGSAVAIALGSTQAEFMSAYLDNIRLQHEEAIEASPVAKAIIRLMHDFDDWEGFPSELLSILNKRDTTFDLSSSPLWPKAPEWMTRRVNEAQTNLETEGIHVEITRNVDGRKIHLTKEVNIPDFTDMPTDDDDSMTAMSVSF